MSYWKEKIQAEDFVLYYHGENGWGQNDAYIIEFRDDNYYIYKHYEKVGHLISKEDWTTFIEDLKIRSAAYSKRYKRHGCDMYEWRLFINLPKFHRKIYNSNRYEFKNFFDELYEKCKLENE